MKPRKAINEILFQTFMAGFDAGKLEENRRGYNIKEAEEALLKILDDLIEAEWQKRSRPVRENHQRLLKRMETLEKRVPKPEATDEA